MIEPIKPIINKFPKKWKQSEKNPLCVEVTEYEEFQNGFDYGEEKDLVGKLNKVIEVLNTLQANTQ